MSQASAILAHLQEGETITPAEAFSMFGCLALHSRIAELRKRGFVIECSLVNGHGQYRLVPPPFPGTQYQCDYVNGEVIEASAGFKK